MFVFTLVGCSGSEGSLDTTNLKKEETVNGKTTYKPVSQKVAKSAVPFDVVTPDYIPFHSQDDENIVISTWGENDRIVLDNTFHSTETKKESIEYIIANFDRFYSKIKKDGRYQKVELGDGTTAYFKTTSFPSAQIHWWKDGMEYNIHHTFYSTDESDAEKNLIKMADSIN